MEEYGLYIARMFSLPLPLADECISKKLIVSTRAKLSLFSISGLNIRSVFFLIWHGHYPDMVNAYNETKELLTFFFKEYLSFGNLAVHGNLAVQ